MQLESATNHNHYLNWSFKKKRREIIWIFSEINTSK